jgi:hypothetical protein
VDGAQHHVRHHVEKHRIVVDRLGASHRQADVGAHAGGFAVEVVEHLDVIADKSNRAEHRGGQARGAFGAQVIADVGLEPRIAGASAAALKGELPVAEPGLLGDQPRRFPQLLLVARRLGHARRDAVSGEYQPGVAAFAGG